MAKLFPMGCDPEEGMLTIDLGMQAVFPMSVEVQQSKVVSFLELSFKLLYKRGFHIIACCESGNVGITGENESEYSSRKIDYNNKFLSLKAQRIHSPS